MRAKSMLLFVACSLCSVSALFAHCEIPCGIYGDDLRFSLMQENVVTIEKSMKMIDELSGDLQNINQLTRWVENKEVHADQLRETITQYFLAQRVKTPANESDKVAFAAYTNQLVLLHKMMVSAMKCKQTTDLKNAKKLHSLLHDFKQAYTSK